ncbi:uncharacterized protein LOC144620899 [Crassostrea virginica]
MGPKKRVTEGPPGTRQKRSKTSESSSTSSNAHVPEQLDYDKLATAIIRQTRSLDPPSVPSSSLVSQNQNNTFCSQAFQPTSSSGIPSQPIQQNQPPSVPSSSLVSQNQNNTSGLGSLIDQIFLGEPTTSNVDCNPELLDEGIPLGASVSQKIKTKIWTNEFIDLRAVLNFKEDPLSVTISSGIINLNHDAKFKNPISIDLWTDAFLVFTAICLEKYPNDAPHLLKYCHTVRESQRLHGDVAFRSYDERFRKLRETRNVPWQKPIAVVVKSCHNPQVSVNKTTESALSCQ